jgi:hypothetical protein
MKSKKPQVPTSKQSAVGRPKKVLPLPPLPERARNVGLTYNPGAKNKAR